jgi:hypothetical protein
MNELQAKHYDLIMDCLAEFDFDRVHKVMTLLDWKYGDSKEVPDIQTLRTTAYSGSVLANLIEKSPVEIQVLPFDTNWEELLNETA